MLGTCFSNPSPAAIPMPELVMRSGLDRSKLQTFMYEIGRSAKGPGRIYFTGGATALLLGLRDQTIDVDIKLDPEPLAVFEVIADLKDRLQINVELAAPDDFIPPLPGWQERSEFITRSGAVEFFHYDFYGQALAKILRGHRTDLSDARALVEIGKVSAPMLEALFDRIKLGLNRYPAIDPAVFAERVCAFVGGSR